MEHRDKVEEFFSCDVLWPLKVITEILADIETSRLHFISIFNLGDGMF